MPFLLNLVEGIAERLVSILIILYFEGEGEAKAEDERLSHTMVKGLFGISIQHPVSFKVLVVDHDMEDFICVVQHLFEGKIRFIVVIIKDELRKKLRNERIFL
jgi:hypothetical protein